MAKSYVPLVANGKFREKYSNEEMADHGVVSVQDAICDGCDEQRVYRLMDKVASVILTEASQYAKSLEPWVNFALDGDSVGYGDMFYDPYQNLFFTAKYKRVMKHPTRDERDSEIDSDSRMHYDRQTKTAKPDKKYPQTFKAVSCQIASDKKARQYAVANYWNGTLTGLGFSFDYDTALHSIEEVADDTVPKYFKPLPVHDNRLGLKGYLTIVSQ